MAAIVSGMAEESKRHEKKPFAILSLAQEMGRSGRLQQWAIIGMLENRE
jgi:hypothetical protein